MKTSKKPLSASGLLVLLLAVALLACKKDKAFDLSGSYDIDQKKALELKPNGQTAVAITLTALADSRCPINAFCANAGLAKVDLNIKDLSINKAKKLSLYLGQNLPKEQPAIAKINLNGSDYAIQLQDIVPYPGVNPANKEKTAIIVLSKL